MTTVVCPFEGCPLRSPHRFCKSDTVILEAGPSNMLQCKTGLIAAYEKKYGEHERSQQDGVQRTTEGSEIGNKECENNES